MTTAVSPQAAAAQAVVLPKNRGAYYAGAWHEPKAGRFVELINPGTGQSLGKVADSARTTSTPPSPRQRQHSQNGGACCRSSARRFFGGSLRSSARTPMSWQ